MNAVIKQLSTEAEGKPYLGESAYEAFWQVAVSTGQATLDPPPFAKLMDDAKWAWHAAGMAAVREVSAV